jgi:hypothetical protein
LMLIRLVLPGVCLGVGMAGSLGGVWQKVRALDRPEPGIQSSLAPIRECPRRLAAAGSQCAHY